MDKRNLNRRDFMKLAWLGGLGLMIKYNPDDPEDPKEISPNDFSKPPYPNYENVVHSQIKWENVSDGLDFSRTNVYMENKLVDTIATLKIDPEKNKIRAFNSYSSEGTDTYFIEEWREKTKALAMINSNQFMREPSGCPCALVICDGVQKGPKFNQHSRGMLVAEPKKGLENKLKTADIIDFDYNPETGEKTYYSQLMATYEKTKNSEDVEERAKAKEYLEQCKEIYKKIKESRLENYTQGVQHWPILLDREGNIKVKEILWQANRTIVAKTNEDKILFMTTEGGYFTLYNLGQFLRDSNEREDNGFNVHTAMNMDGGYEAGMVLRTPELSYRVYGFFESKKPGKNLFSFPMKISLPGVIGVFKSD